MTLCPDCLRAERELWPVYVQHRWCCRARWIFDASVSNVEHGITLDDARRALSEREKTLYPDDWPLVRERLKALRARAESQEKV